MTRCARKTYEFHDGVYRDLRAKGLRHWSDKSKATQPVKCGIDSHDERFLADALAQEWVPKSGKAVELGCGSGTMLRWLWSRGFKGLGVDVSRTAVQMAREQSRDFRGLRFQCADVVHKPLGAAGTYDLALDGHWLHCLTQQRDRTVALERVRKLLTPGGVFIVLTMCAPVNETRFASLYPDQRLRNHVIYHPGEHADQFEGSRTLGGRACLPTRYIGHWKDILREVRQAAFEPRLIRLNHAYGDEVVGSLCIAAVAV
jgi:SAM-dependent methyltransferase